jgi:predicted transglutaminase-like cysteine proteinase
MLELPSRNYPVSLLTIAAVHDWAQAHFEWTPDGDVWKVPEYWATWEELRTSDVVKGDCDDFAAMCIAACRHLGYDAYYATCWDESGRYHCVCIVMLSPNAHYVLDNRHGALETKQSLENLGYSWDSISGKEPNQPWSKLI